MLPVDHFSDDLDSKTKSKKSSTTMEEEKAEISSKIRKELVKIAKDELTGKNEHFISRVDFEFRESIWKGKIPVLFSLSENEVISKSQPPKLFLLLPRMTYLPLVTDRVRNHFSPHAPALEDGMWFENVNGNEKEALKWHFPIGVLYDLYSQSIENMNNKNNSNNCNPYPIPWQLIVHFQSYPQSNIIARCDNVACVKSVYFNYLKQSTLLSYNTVNIVTKLQMDDQNQLWNSVCQSNYSLFLPIYQAMFSKHHKTNINTSNTTENENENTNDNNNNVEKDNNNESNIDNEKKNENNDTTTTTNDNDATNENEKNEKSNKKRKHHNGMQKYPLRILVKGFDAEIDLIPIQRPIDVPENPDDDLSLEDCLDKIVPGILDMYKDDLKIQDSRKRRIFLRIQGLCVPLNTPMSWLIRHACHADCFLYVIIVQIKD